MSKKAKNRTPKSPIFAIALFLVASIFVVKAFSPQKEVPAFQKNSSTPVQSSQTSQAAAPSNMPEPAALRLNSSNAILIRMDDGSVLMQKNSGEEIYPASLTKIMTVLVAIENLPDLNEKIELSDTMFKNLYQENASLAGFVPKERVPVLSLLYGAMLPSGAECCTALANRISGSEQSFVDLMNKKAKQLGMRNTRFENSVGLDSKSHYSTVKDLSVLLRSALKNNTFRTIFTAQKYSTGPTNKHPKGITFVSSMFEKLKNPAVPGGAILGGKTGYTEKAGLCLASLAQENGKEYILITAGANGDHKSEQYNITDALAVYDSIPGYLSK